MTQLTSVLQAIADGFIQARDELNLLDSVAGDGDLGVTMGRTGMAIKNVIADHSESAATDILKRCGMAIARDAPSTAGTLVGTGFLRASAAIAEHDGGALSIVEQVERALRAAEKGIAERGKASLGDRTMLDALHPAVEKLAEIRDARGSLDLAVAEAAVAAAEGAERTKTMEPRKGRAAWLSERAAGYVDAGARVIVIGFASAARALHRAEQHTD